MLTNSSVVATEGDDVLVSNDILNVALGLLEGHVLNGCARLAHVLVLGAQVGALCLAGLGRVQSYGVFTHVFSPLIQRSKK